MPRKTVYPARESVRVPKPGGGFLRPEGEAVIFEGSDARWWRRRVADGDATFEAPAAPEANPAETATEPKPKRAKRARKSPDQADASGDTEN